MWCPFSALNQFARNKLNSLDGAEPKGKMSQMQYHMRPFTALAMG
jgi:hypothetical protein